MRQDEIAQSLGRLEGQMQHVSKSVDDMNTKIDAIDGRLRAVELKSGVISMTVSSAIAALGYALGNPPA